MRTSLLFASAASVLLFACPGEPPPPTRPPAPAPEPPTALPAPSANGRLPALAAPVAYQLELDVDPNKERFVGNVRVDVDIPQRTSWIVMHGRGLTIQSARAVIGRSAPLEAKVTTRVSTGGKVPEELVLGFAQPLPPGRATLVIDYSAPFDDSLAGLYRVKDGDEWYVFSQFEATDARRAFPSFDEPGFKTPFDLAIDIPNGQKAFSNTSEAMRESLPDGRTRVRFKRTAPLPTYLVAVAVGDFEVEEATRYTRPPIRIITTKKASKPAQNKLALETTGALTDELAKWFGIPYPYEKLDIVAVPALSAGAMENAGLVTYRAEVLLVDPARASEQDRRLQAIFIGHELAHQWFGDLVTAEWWNDLWLNEGFATWMENRIVEIWHPEWGAKLDAVMSEHRVMDIDGLAAARAVRQPAVSTSDIEEAFDGITYEKGAAVLSTIEHWVGEEKFKAAVRDYLTTNAHKNAGTDKLFASLDRVSGKDVTGLAQGYLDQPGVPEVVAAIQCEPASRWHVDLTSRSWRPLGSSTGDEDARFWTIPVCVRAEGSKTEQCADLIGGAPSVIAGRGPCPKYVHPNSALSYYRWSMPPRSMVNLATAQKQFDPAARISILSNLWSSVRGGDMDAKYILEALPAFDDEMTLQPVTMLIDILEAMSDSIVEEDVRPEFKKWVAARLAKRKKALGWKGKAGDEALLRRDVLFALANLADDEATLREADEYARRWLADPTTVEPDVAVAAVAIASHKAGDDRVDALVAALKKSLSEQDHTVALRALGAFDDPARLTKALDKVLTKDIEPNEVRRVLEAGVQRPAGRMTTEEWMMKHWDELRAKLPGQLSIPLFRIAGHGCTSKEVDELKSFYEPRAQPVEGADREFKQSLEDVELCVALRRKAAASISNALKKVR